LIGAGVVDSKDKARFYADNSGLIHKVARAGYTRLVSMGVSGMEYEDLYQELAIVFLDSFDLYDPNSGFKFSTYFTTSAYRRVNKIADKVSDERIRNGVRSVEEMNSWSDDGESDIGNTFPSKFPTPEEIMAGATMARDILSTLSPVAALLANYTISPPDFIEREFAAAQAFADKARSEGVEKRAYQFLGLAYVCALAQKLKLFPSAAITAAKAEIIQSAKRVAA
jgi:DNA-directed RNA polymerase specialized sigma24 family protein